jgi:error-prone DNA polymerase
MLCKADSVGVFQVESRAQMTMLPRLKPRCYYDLVIEVAIVRPGPIQGNMVHPYLRRRSGEEEVEYPSEEVRHVLERTLGVPLFQEQAMQLAVVAAGFTPGEADQLRRAMAAWRRAGMIDDYRTKLVDGMLAKGYTPEFAERLFNQIRGFGEYGFPESHAASFAKLAYVSSWLKHYCPAAFVAAMINSQPMGFYAPAQLIRDAQAHGVEVRPVDVNESEWDCTLEGSGQRAGGNGPWGKRAGSSPTPGRGQDGPLALRLGLRLVRGLPEAVARDIVKVRTTRFGSVAELTARAGLGRAAVKRLAEADAFGSLQLNRRAALWQALEQTASVEDLPLLAGIEASDLSTPALPELSPQQEVYADYHSAGLTLRAHPLSFFRGELEKLRVSPAARLLQCAHGTNVKVAGLVLMRQRPGTAKGITFVTLEDETGIANLIVHARTWQRYELAARRATALLVEGRLERKDQVIHVIARRLEDMQAQLQKLTHHSRDFR